MPLNTLRKIWLAVALIDLIVCVDFIAIVQGWPINIGTDLVVDLKPGEFTKDERPQAALHGLLAALPFLIVTMWLAWVHAARATGGFAERMPFRILDVNPSSDDGKVIQGIAFVATMIIPLYAVGHFWLKILAQTLCFDAQGTSRRDISIFALDWTQGTNRSPWEILDNDFRFAPVGVTACNGPTFQPLLEPVVLGMLTLLAVWFFLRFIQLCRRGASATAG